MALWIVFGVLAIIAAGMIIRFIQIVVYQRTILKQQIEDEAAVLYDLTAQVQESRRHEQYGLPYPTPDAATADVLATRVRSRAQQYNGALETAQDVDVAVEDILAETQVRTDTNIMRHVSLQLNRTLDEHTALETREAQLSNVEQSVMQKNKAEPTRSEEE